MGILGRAMSVLIYSTHSENIREMYDITYPNKKKYASHHGYELFSKDWAYGDWKPLIEEFRDLLKCYDYILALDCDAVFTNQSIRVEDKVDVSDNRVVIAQEFLGNDPVNGGVTIWNRNMESSTLWDDIGSCISDWQGKQTNIQGYISSHLSGKYKPLIRVVPPRHMNAGIMPSRDGHAANAGTWHKGDWIFHPYAYSYQEKISYINKALTDVI
jgi:hypothetical protein